MFSYSISQYFTVFHSISQYLTISYTHQDRLAMRLLTRRPSLVLAARDHVPPATRTWSENPNLSRNRRFIVGWQLYGTSTSQLELSASGGGRPGRRRGRRPNQA